MKSSREKDCEVQGICKQSTNRDGAGGESKRIPMVCDGTISF